MSKLVPAGGESKIANIPHIQDVTKAATCSLCVKVLLEVFLSAAIIGVVVSSIKLISHDVDLETRVHYDEELKQIADCRHDYEINKCSQDDKLPAMVQLCNKWKVCMETKPRDTTKSKIAARFTAQLINEFVNPLSPKTIITVIVLVIVLVILRE